MTSMSVAGIAGLVEDIGVSLGLPLLFLCLAFANIKLSSKRKHSGLKMRASLTFAIALFAYLIGTLMFQDRSVLMTLWQRNPILYSLAYIASGVVVLAGVGALVNWKLRPTLWRNDHE